MDIWAMLGVSRQAGVGGLVVGIVLLGLIAVRLLRRSRKPERVFVDLSGRG